MSSCKHCSDSLLKGMKEPIRIEHEIFSGSKGIQLVGQQLVGLWKTGCWLTHSAPLTSILVIFMMRYLAADEYSGLGFPRQYGR